MEVAERAILLQPLLDLPLVRPRGERLALVEQRATGDVSPIEDECSS
jgi:hypothetical protein